MARKLNIYIPGTWKYAREKPLMYKGHKLVFNEYGKILTEKKFIEIVQNQINENKYEFSSQFPLNNFIDKVLEIINEITEEFNNSPKVEFNLFDFSTWLFCDTPKKLLKYKGKRIYKSWDLKFFTIYDFISATYDYFELFKGEKFTTLEEKNNYILRTLERLYKDQTSKKIMKKRIAEYEKQSKEELKRWEEEQKKEDEKNGIIPSEMSGYKVSGHELTLAQYTLLHDFYRLDKNSIKRIVKTYYNGRKQKKRGYQIRQDLFFQIRNYNTDFIYYIMRAEYYCDEKQEFTDWLYDWVSESDTAEEIEKIFSSKYFKKHTEIREEILNNNAYWKLENGKVVRNEESE